MLKEKKYSSVTLQWKEETIVYVMCNEHINFAKTICVNELLTCIVTNQYCCVTWGSKHKKSRNYRYG